MSRLPVLLFLAFALLCSCREAALPPGTVASVNGELISLHSLQALLDSRSVDLGIPARPSVAEMRERYRHALSILIAHALARQELASRGIDPDEKDVDEAIARIREDFGPDSLQDYFAETFLREDEWRQLMRDHLAVNILMERVLEPGLKVSLDEVRKYYEEHKQSLSVPEIARICHAAAKDRDEVAAWCEKAEFENSPLAQCVDISPDSIPEPWASEAKKLRPGECGRIIGQEGQWRTVALLRKDGAREPRLSEIYGLIEARLLEEKKLEAFDSWLAQKLGASRVLVNPELFSANAS
ncbi:MAG: peptidyl-prolyl cis-trans isomerase [Desulfovibrio sp.]|nr:peptidyl-prolyl cis-trans isomerase [Desulfovibrio sp.]